MRWCRHMILGGVMVMGAGCYFNDPLANPDSIMSQQDMREVREPDMPPFSTDLGEMSDMPVTSGDQGAPREDMAMDQDTSDQDVPEDMMRPVDMNMSSPMCGNGKLEAGEVCDGDCPVSCDDGDACTSNLRAGDDSNCNVVCSYTEITSCVSNDGCCPMGCDSSQDQDCMLPTMLDCTDTTTWPSTWTGVEFSTKDQISDVRTSGMCNSDVYPVRSAYEFQNAGLRQVARCMAVWKKNNPDATGQQLATQLGIELERSSYRRSNVRLIGGGGNSLAAAQGQLSSTTQNCQHITDSDYVKIGVGYIDDTAGSNDHVVMIVLGE